MKTAVITEIRFVFYFTGFFIFCTSSTIEAQKTTEIEESLQEFFTGETVYAQEKKEVQFTLKPAYWKKEEMKRISIPLQFEYGVTDRFQVELNLPYYFLVPKVGKGVNGIGNTEVGFLYNVIKANEPFALSLALEVALPTAQKEKGIDEEEVEWEPSLIVARQIGRVQVHAGFAAEITKSEPTVFNYNLATVFAFGDWRTTLELNGKIDGEKIIYLTPGLLWEGLDDFEFGLAISKSMTKNYTACGVIFMVTHEFSLAKKNKQHR